MAETTFHLTAQDGTRLTGSAWLPKKPKQLLLWIHGFAEHRKRYAHFANWLNEKRVAFAAIDVRGHGESDGRRGYVKDFSDYFLDCSAFLHWARTTHPKLPTTLGCHSHGGLIVSRYLEENTPPIPIRCLIFTAPFLGLPPTFPMSKLKLGMRVSKFLPKLSIPADLDATYLSHDNRIVQSYIHDPLVFKKATTGWFAQAVENHGHAISRAPFIKLPALVMQGTADRIVNVDSSRRFFLDLGSGRKFWIPYKNMFHEILNEVDRLRVYEDLFQFLKRYGK